MQLEDAHHEPSVYSTKHRGRKLYRFSACAVWTCGSPVLTLRRAACTRRLCKAGLRCNNCSITIKAKDLPVIYRRTWGRRSYRKYGVKFSKKACPFLAITSAWRLGSSSWFAKNRLIAGCRPRVACRTRGGKRFRGRSPFDVTVTAAGCYKNVYGLGNAPSISQCLAGRIAGGVPFRTSLRRQLPRSPRLGHNIFEIGLQQ